MQQASRVVLSLSLSHDYISTKLAFLHFVRRYPNAKKGFLEQSRDRDRAGCAMRSFGLYMVGGFCI